MNAKHLHLGHTVKYILLALLGMATYFWFYGTAHAAYTQPFIISAYYSPLEGQSRYVTGSLAGDIGLNGSGINSADGTPVYPGMIAAPSTYAFGTKMDIPGIGTVAVHDRGGAIVTAGNRGHAYDRLDVWMGYGDEGLNRALNWGKRTVSVTVYGIDPNKKENVYLEGFTEAEKFIRNIVVQQTIFTFDMGYGVSGDKVGELQQYMLDLGYYKGKIDNYYGDEVYKAVLAFQIDEGIIDREEDFGSGYLGPQTRARLEAVILNRKKDNLPKKNLGKDDTGKEVIKLQKALQKLGYDVEVTGIYDDKTIDAVFEFQRDNEIIGEADKIGAGYFGAKTFSVLSQKLSDFNNNVIDNIKNTEILKAPFTAFTADLKLGDSGEEVKRLQEDLMKFNLFGIEPTGYYGTLTEHAVYKFQQRKEIVASKTESGAGTFGPQTRNAFNSILGYRANTKALIASATLDFQEKVNEVLVAEETEPVVKTANFTQELLVGSTGDQVSLLQETLKTLGFYTSSVTTDYFGNSTRDAVIAFQQSEGIIAARNESGAGLVGPQTRAALNSLSN